MTSPACCQWTRSSQANLNLGAVGSGKQLENLGLLVGVKTVQHVLVLLHVRFTLSLAVLTVTLVDRHSVADSQSQEERPGPKSSRIRYVWV